jgi:NAD(P)-dependent dehydrogenase (short-subunit alcohol dehydrogenase family)
VSGRLAGRVAIVTGTSPNIGGGIAEALSGEGASVCAVDRDPGLSDACARYLRGSGAPAIAAPADVTDAGQVDAAVSAALEEFGRVDILVNAAVVFGGGGVLDIDLGQWRRQVDVILTGALLMTRRVATSMVGAGTGGAVINVASSAAHQGEPGNIAYSTAKAGLLNFTRAAAMDLAASGIRVNSLTPTSTDPANAVERARRWGLEPAALSAQAQAAFARARDRLPLRTLPTAADYGRAAAFLASDDARMVTGFDLRVDAGALAQYWRIPAPAAGAGDGEATHE